MKRLILFLAFIACASLPALAQQSGYGGDGKAASGANVSSFIRLYETAPGASTTALAGAGAGNVDNGAHLVKVTCYTPGGQTTGGTASNSTTVADKTTNGRIAISAIPTCSSIATGRKVYMTAAGGSSYFLLSNGTIADNTTTTLTANDADATLTASTALPTSNTALDTRLTVGQSTLTSATAITAGGDITTGSAGYLNIGHSGATGYGIITVPASRGIRLYQGTGAGTAGNVVLFQIASDGSTASFGGGTTQFGSAAYHAILSSTGNNNMSIRAGDGNSARTSSVYITTKDDQVRVTVDSTGLATFANFIQNAAGEGSLTAAFTNATTTMSNTLLSYTVVAGRSYRIHGVLAIANSTAGNGVKLDFDGGSATATTFWAAAAVVSGSVVAGTTASATLAGDINFTTVTGTTYIVIDGYLKVNAAGTFILRAAEDSTGGASASIAAGSWIALSDTVLK